MSTQQSTGIVKFFDTDKGFGFIRRRHGEDVFVHISDVKQTGLTELFEGQQVDFEVKQTPKGPQAVNVQAHEFEPRRPPELEPAAAEPVSLSSVFYAAALGVFESEGLDPNECKIWLGKSLAELDPKFRIDLDAVGPDDEGQDRSFEQNLEMLDRLGELAGLRVAREDVLSFLRERGGEPEEG